jgi:hypothetical protein
MRLRARVASPRVAVAVDAHEGEHAQADLAAVDLGAVSR